MPRRFHAVLIVAWTAWSLLGVVHAQAVRLRPSPTPIYSGREGVALAEPQGVACRDSTVVIADTGNARLVGFAIEGGALRPVSVWPTGQITMPLHVEIGSGGEFWVLDGRRLQIGRFSADGEFVGFLELGDGDRSVVPRSFRVDPKGDLYVLDARASRVLVVTPEGDERRKIASPPELLFASDLALGPQGTVYVVDSVGHRVYSASKGDKVLAPLSDDLSEDLDFATSIAVDERGNLFLGDQNGGGIVVLGRDGSFRGRQSRYGWKPGMLRYPTGLCVDRGVLFVADRGNNRVQMFEVAE